MNLKWFKGLDEHNKKLVKQDILAARPAFKRLLILLEEEHATIVNKIETKYSMNNHKVQVAELRAMTKLINLIKET